MCLQYLQRDPKSIPPKIFFCHFLRPLGLLHGRTLSGEILNPILIVNMLYPTGFGPFSAESVPQHFRKLNFISASYIMVRARIKSSQNRAQVRRKTVPASKNSKPGPKLIASMGILPSAGQSSLKHDDPG